VTERRECRIRTLPAFVASGLTQVAMGAALPVLVFSDGDQVEVTIGGYRWHLSCADPDPRNAGQHTLTE
jgi:hypothetical protein